MPAARLCCLPLLPLVVAALLGADCASSSEGRAVADSPTDQSTSVVVGGVLDGTSCPAPDLMAHGFDDGKWGPFTDAREGVRVVRDSTANGGWSLRKDWRRGSHDGGTVWGLWEKPVQALHVRFRYKQDKTFDNTGIKKIVRVQGPTYGEMLGSLVIHWGRFGWAWDGATEDWSREFTINVGKEVRPDDLRGDWHWYEIWVDIATDRQLRMKMWIDGRLRMNHTAPYRNLGVTYGTVQFTRTFNAPAATGTTWLDDLAVSTQCIGIPPAVTAAAAAAPTP